MTHIPRASDALDLADHDPSWLVWMVGLDDAMVVRSAPTFDAVIDAARAYSAAWNARVAIVEDPAGSPVAEELWVPLLRTDDPLPYLYTVECRSPSVAGRECVSTLWTTTDLESAIRHRALLPQHLRVRTLIVSNSPDGRSPRSNRRLGRGDAPTRERSAAGC